MLRDYLPEEFTVATEAEIEQATSKARTAFEIYRKSTAEARASFLEMIGEVIAAFYGHIQCATGFNLYE